MFEGEKNFLQAHTPRKKKNQCELTENAKNR